jgi:hypothetical protein
VFPKRYCYSKACQRARRCGWQRNRLRIDNDYRDNQTRTQAKWRANHPNYWRKYRAAHPRVAGVAARQANCKDGR